MMEGYNKRSITDVFFNDLKKGKLNDILKMVTSDDTLCMELRGNRVVIYYRGGALYTIEEKAEHEYSIWFNDNYCSINKDINKSVSKHFLSTQETIEDVYKYKYYMDIYFSKHKKFEREFQQLIVRDNNFSGKVTDATDYYILDIEYALKYDEIDARYDMLAVEWPSISGERKNPTNLPFAIIEVKYGDGSLTGPAGIQKHIDDYVALRKNTQLISVMASDMSEVFNQKHELGLITSYKDKRGELNISIDDKNVQYLFIFANHDPDKSEVKKELELAIEKYKDTEYSSILGEIKVAKSSEMGYGLYAYVNNEYCYPTIAEYVAQ